MSAVDSFGSRATLHVQGEEYEIFRLRAVTGAENLPMSLKVLCENLLRTEDGANITAEHIRALTDWQPQDEPQVEIQFTPGRVIMQDFTGVPCIVDLATMREAVQKMGGDPRRVNPLVPTELVIDHSVQIDAFGSPAALERNIEMEYRRNGERYQFLRWGQSSFDNFRVVPPGTGIVHQVNIEYLARTVMTSSYVSPQGKTVTRAYPDTCVGTDSHTTMVNGLGVLGWGVGGIEAEAAMLGQPVSMLIPKVVGFKLSGAIPAGATATDVVLTITEILRRHGVVGKFVEFYGEGVSAVPLANRATIGNMSPEFGSTVAMFPIDQVTLEYLRFTGRSERNLALVEAYAKEQGLWHDPQHEPRYSEYLELDLSTVVPSIAGPKRPQDRIRLAEAKTQFRQDLPDYISGAEERTDVELSAPLLRQGKLESAADGAQGRPSSPQEVTTRDGRSFIVDHGAVAIASITSCTNTSNPSVMLAAALVARNAVRRGLQAKPWVKTSVAPGSKVVTGYYEKSGLLTSLADLGFYVVGYGCTTCIGNSGPLDEEISRAVREHDLAVTAVLSGNRNFEGRINPDVKMNYLGSPPLVIAYALAGTLDFDFATQALGRDSQGQPVFLRDIWPSPEEIQEAIESSIDQDMFIASYASVFEGDERWKALQTPTGDTFAWAEQSTYVRKPPYFDQLDSAPQAVHDIVGARVLAMLGDSVTTDHISPAGSFTSTTPAGEYLLAHGVDRKDFNSYGSRRGNHEVMIRGTFANIRLRNQLLAEEHDGQGIEGGFTRDFTLDGSPLSTIYDAAMHYRAADVPLVVLAGREYGSGSSRDWAAKGTALLGVRAVIAEGYERIHRSNLLGMGVLPLQYLEGQNARVLQLSGREAFTIEGITALNAGQTPKTVSVTARDENGAEQTFNLLVRIDTPGEADYYRNGGILPYVLRQISARNEQQ